MLLSLILLFILFFTFMLFIFLISSSSSFIIYKMTTSLKKQIIDWDIIYEGKTYNGKTYEEVINIFKSEDGVSLLGLNKCIRFFVSYFKHKSESYTTELNNLLHTEFEQQNLTSPVDAPQNEYLFKLIGDNEPEELKLIVNGKTVKETIELMVDSYLSDIEGWFNSYDNTKILVDGSETGMYDKVRQYHEMLINLRDGNLLETVIYLPRVDGPDFHQQLNGSTYRQAINIFKSEYGISLRGLNRTIRWFVSYLRHTGDSYTTELNNILHSEFDQLNLTSPVEAPQNEYLFKLIGDNEPSGSDPNYKTVKETIELMVANNLSNIEGWFNSYNNTKILVDGSETGMYDKVRQYHEMLVNPNSANPNSANPNSANPNSPEEIALEQQLSEQLQQSILGTLINWEWEEGGPDNRSDLHGLTYRQAIDIFKSDLGISLYSLNQTIRWFISYFKISDNSYTTELNNILHTEFEQTNLTSPVDSPENEYLFKLIGDNEPSGSVNNGETVKQVIEIMVADNYSNIEAWFNSYNNTKILVNGSETGMYNKIRIYRGILAYPSSTEEITINQQLFGQLQQSILESVMDWPYAYGAATFGTSHSEIISINNKTFRQIIEYYKSEYGMNLQVLNRIIRIFIKYFKYTGHSYSTQLNNILHLEFEQPNLTSPVNSPVNEYLFKLIGDNEPSGSDHNYKTVKETIELMVADNYSEIEGWFNSYNNTKILVNGSETGMYDKVRQYREMISNPQTSEQILFTEQIELLIIQDILGTVINATYLRNLTTYPERSLYGKTFNEAIDLFKRIGGLYGLNRAIRFFILYYKDGASGTYRTELNDIIHDRFGITNLTSPIDATENQYLFKLIGDNEFSGSALYRYTVKESIELMIGTDTNSSNIEGWFSSYNNTKILVDGSEIGMSDKISNYVNKLINLENYSLEEKEEFREELIRQTEEDELNKKIRWPSSELDDKTYRQAIQSLKLDNGETLDGLNLTIRWFSIYFRVRTQLTDRTYSLSPGLNSALHREFNQYNFIGGVGGDSLGNAYRHNHPVIWNPYLFKLIGHDETSGSNHAGRVVKNVIEIMATDQNPWTEQQINNWWSSYNNTKIRVNGQEIGIFNYIRDYFEFTQNVHISSIDNLRQHPDNTDEQHAEFVDGVIKFKSELISQRNPYLARAIR